ncbi:MAG TPA: hypothetical protein H9730_12525 [Candidatus Mediterraneibacter stercoripullorum]|nr:hypothetical protein [Candidatus Mediterraneibacter stercoripullorum]
MERNEIKKTEKKGKKRKRRFGTPAGWAALILIVLIAIPVGGVMLFLSGIWSAADRILSRINGI